MNAAHAQRVHTVWRGLAGRASVAVVTGPAGAGKSRFVADAVASLRPAPALTLLGHPRVPAPAPYDWTATALRAHIDTLPVPPGVLAWLLQTDAAPPQRLEPTALLRAAGDAVAHTIGDGPGVIVAENLHALDPASIALLEQLAERELNAMLLLVTRPADGERYPKPAARLLKRLQEDDAVFIHVEPDFDPVTCDPIAEAGWARYARALGDHTAAAVAGMRAAAEELRRGETAAAREALDDALGPAETAADGDARSLLSRGLLWRERIDEADDTADGPSSRQLRADLAALDDLTARERDVLRCLAAGMTNRQVASRLGISVRTVTVHVSNLLRKTGTGSRTEAALWAVRQRLT